MSLPYKTIRDQSSKRQELFAFSSIEQMRNDYTDRDGNLYYNIHQISNDKLGNVFQCPSADAPVSGWYEDGVSA